jgi:hypothetical protein
MQLKRPKYHFKCGWQMKIVLSATILSAVIFLAFNLYIVACADGIEQNVEGSWWLGKWLFFIRESIVANLKNGGRMLYVLSAICSLTLLWGAVRMWMGRIWGLVFYSASKIALITMPMLFVGEGSVASGDIMLAMFFLIFYSIYIMNHKMRLE